MILHYGKKSLFKFDNFWSSEFHNGLGTKNRFQQVCTFHNGCNCKQGIDQQFLTGNPNVLKAFKS